MADEEIINFHSGDEFSQYRITTFEEKIQSIYTVYFKNLPFYAEVYI